MAAIFPQELGYDKGIKMIEPERLPRIVEGLTAKGYGSASLTKILGGNLMRIAGEVWK